MLPIDQSVVIRPRLLSTQYTGRHPSSPLGAVALVIRRLRHHLAAAAANRDTSLDSASHPNLRRPTRDVDARTYPTVDTSVRTPSATSGEDEEARALARIRVAASRRMSSMRSSAACRRVTSQYNSLYALRKTRVSPFHRLDVSTGVTRLNTARRVDEDADVDALFSSRRARRPLTRARRLLVLMRVIKTKKKSSHTVWSLTDVACVVLACVIAAFVVVCASRAMGGASTDSSTDAWSTRDSLRDVDARAFGKDPDACARAASIGTWRRGAEACEGGTRALASDGCDAGDAVLARVREEEISLGRENVGDELESERNVWIRTVASDRARVQGERVDRRQARGVRRGLGGETRVRGVHRGDER